MAFRRRSRDAKIELLRGVPLFSACSRRELTRIASLADEVEVSEGRELIREGDVGKEFFVIVNGEAKVSARGRRAKKVGPGTALGELALFDQAPRSATVTALSDMELLVLDSRSFSSLIAEVPSVARKLFRVMAQRLREAEAEPTH
jgi:CRP-like cAMP-binding protein